MYYNIYISVSFPCKYRSMTRHSSRKNDLADASDGRLVPCTYDVCRVCGDLEHFTNFMTFMTATVATTFWTAATGESYPECLALYYFWSIFKRKKHPPFNGPPHLTRKTYALINKHRTRVITAILWYNRALTISKKPMTVNRIISSRTIVFVFFFLK